MLYVEVEWNASYWARDCEGLVLNQTPSSWQNRVLASVVKHSKKHVKKRKKHFRAAFFFTGLNLIPTWEVQQNFFPALNSHKEPVIVEK